MQSEFILSKVKKMEFYRNLANNGISKMRVLVIFQSQCSALGIYLGKASILRNSFNSKNQSVLFVLCCGIVSCCLQLIYEANSFKDFINSIYTISAILTCTTCFCALIWKSPLLSKYLDKLEKTINKRLEHPDSKLLYENINPKVELACRIIVFGAVKFLCPCLTFSHFILSYFQYFRMDLHDDAFMLTCPFWFPFAWKNPLGYPIAFALQYIALMHIFQFLACAISLEIGAFLLTTTLTEDIKSSASGLNFMKNSKSQSAKQLCDFIWFHSTGKGLISDISDVAQPIFMTLFSWSCIATCGALLLIAMELSRDTAIAIVQITDPLVMLCLAFVPVAMTCELTGQMSMGFDGIYDEIMKFKWYLWPRKTQKLLLIFLPNAQQPVRFECYGSISSDRDTLKRVINCTYSYFMLLHEFIL